MKADGLISQQDLLQFESERDRFDEQYRNWEEGKEEDLRAFRKEFTPNSAPGASDSETGSISGESERWRGGNKTRRELDELQFKLETVEDQVLLDD